MKHTNKLLWYVFIISSLFYCYEFFLRISPGILVQQLLSQYHGSALAIGEFASSYYLGYVLMQIPAGILYDRYAFKYVSGLALLGCVLGSMMFTLGTHIYIGVLGRFILGAGSAFAFIGAIAFVKKYLPEKYFTLLIAIVISLGTIFGAFGQVFAVKIIEYLHWHTTIIGMATWGIVLAFAIMLVPTHDFKPTHHYAPVSWDCIKQQLKTICQQRAMWLNGILGSLFYLPTAILAATWGIELFTVQYHFTVSQGSYAIMLLFVGWAVGSPLFGWLVDKFAGEKIIITTAAGIAAAIIAYILLAKNISPSMLYLALFLFGLVSSAQVLVWHIFAGLLPDKRLVGTGSAFTNLLIMLSIAIWELVLGKAINTLQHNFSNTEIFTAFDLRTALLSLPVLLIIVCLLAQCLPQRASTESARQ